MTIAPNQNSSETEVYSNQQRSDIWRLVSSLIIMHACFIYFGLLFNKWSGVFMSHMAFLTLVLACFAFFARKPLFEKFHAGQIFTGIISAAALYAIFLIGNTISSHIISTSSADVMKIYDLGSNMPKPLLVLLLMFPIAFGEEIFWRGCLQKYISERWSPKAGFALTVIAYTSAHIASKNIVLIGASAVCGIFWGYLYYRTRSILPCIVSHMVFTPAVFVLLPVM